MRDWHVDLEAWGLRIKDFGFGRKERWNDGIPSIAHNGVLSQDAIPS